MSLFLVPGDRKNIEQSIETSVNLNLARQFLSADFIEEILKYSGLEGIRCWAMTKARNSLFDQMRHGDEVLLSESGTKKFTHYGVIIGKTKNKSFGNALWPVVGNSPWENIYFLANITNINFDKSKLVATLGYQEIYTVPGPIKVDNLKYNNSTTFSFKYDIPVFDSVAESAPNQDYSSENVNTQSTRRKGHVKFSKDIKTLYDYKCVVCGISESEFLVAGHIARWSEDIENRLNPKNGICFCSLHDKAFEHAYIGFDDNYRLLISNKINLKSLLYKQLIVSKDIQINNSNLPDRLLLKAHRAKHKLGEYESE